MLRSHNFILRPTALFLVITRNYTCLISSKKNTWISIKGRQKALCSSTTPGVIEHSLSHFCITSSSTFEQCRRHPNSSDNGRLLLKSPDQCQRQLNIEAWPVRDDVWIIKRRKFRSADLTFVRQWNILTIFRARISKTTGWINNPRVSLADGCIDW